MFQERKYRDNMGHNLDTFLIVLHETDLWIAISKGYFDFSLKNDLEHYLVEKRKELINYIVKDPLFQTTLEPYDVTNEAPEFIRKMSKASFIAGVGPMAGVAGVFSFIAGDFLKARKIPEIIVENGGDIFVSGFENIKVGVFAGNSPFSEKIILDISLDKEDWGICSSSGTIGHSLSFGKADVVTIVSKDIVLADEIATASCNNIKTKEDIDSEIERLKSKDYIKGALIIMEDKLAAFGNLEIKGRG